MVIGTAQHHNADTIFAFQLVHYLARPPANAGLVVGQRLVADFDGAIVFFERQSEDRLPGLQHLMRKQFAIGKIEDGIDVLYVVLGENVILLSERRFHGFGCCGHGWASVGADDFNQGRCQHVIHREENNIQGFLAMLLLDQVVHVRNTDLRRETGIDRAPASARAVKFRAGVVGVDDVFRLHTQTLEISVEERGVGVNVQHARNSDTKLLAAFHERNALFCRLVPELRYRNGIGHSLRVNRTEDLASSEVYEVWILVFYLVDTGFDLLHVIDIFDQAFFASRDNQALFAVHQRNLRDLLNWNDAQVILGSGSDVDECAQTIVLAEVAACGFVARGAVLNFAHRLQSDKASLQAIAPQTDRLDRSSDRSGLSAEFVDDDFWFLAGGAEAVVDEVDFRFHHGHVVLRSALQDEARAQCREIGNAGHVQENIFRKHSRQPCENFLGAPALTLEIHDVRLHKDGAAVAENRHRLG